MKQNVTVPVRTQNWPQDTRPVVSVMCFAYNQNRYIPQCLDAILGQLTDFPVEILVHDDASTDGTAEIIIEYARKFPGILKPVLQTENQFSRHRRIRSILHAHVRGDFVASCDGDDVWLDPCKLSKQVGFLREHPEYVLSYHDAVLIDDAGRELKKNYLPKVFQRDYLREELRIFSWMLSGTIMYRNVDIDFPPEYHLTPNGDNFLPILLAPHGGAKFQAEVGPLAYRQHAGGIWSQKNPAEQARMHLQSDLQITCYLVRTGDVEAARKVITGRFSIHAQEFFGFHDPIRRTSDKLS